MSNPHDVFTVALSRSQINELLAVSNIVNPPAGLQEAQFILRRTVRPVQTSNTARVKKWGT